MIMPYLIDGHNLIPHIPGINLAMADDEERLIRLLQIFAGKARTKITIFFDGAPPGEARTARFGPVTAIFIRQGSSADQGIATFLHKLGKRARTWWVVSSDRQVQAYARSAGAQVLTASEFATRLAVSGSPPAEPAPEKPDARLTDQELAEWLTLFKRQTD
jgi:uncharacterized protein